MLITHEQRDQLNDIKKRLKEITKDMSPLEERAFYHSLYIQLKRAVEERGESNA